MQFFCIWKQHEYIFQIHEKMKAEKGLLVEKSDIQYKVDLFFIY